jgi:outer membrane protein assembly factor BamB
MQFQSGAGGTLESELYIYNTGGSNLTVEISDVVTNVSAERLFGAGYNMIYEINPDNGQIINSFSTPIFTSDYSTGLAFSGEHLYFTNPESSPNIFVLDPQNGNIITYYSSQSNNCNGLAYIDPYLYVLDAYNNAIRVLNPINGNSINVIYPSVYIYWS